MNIKKFFIADNYISHLRLYKKKLKIIKLDKASHHSVKLKPIWLLNKNSTPELIDSSDNNYSIFGHKID
jgi:hypothetical protein